jgi:hypothetical protein
MSYYETVAQWEFDNRGIKPKENIVAGREYPDSNIEGTNVLLFVLLVIYVLGVLLCLTRTWWALRWIWKMITISPKEEIDGVKVIKLQNPTAPFSFFRYAFVHDAMVDTPEFDHILAHERTHIEQRHSIDLVFVQLLAAFFWFNPVIWRLIKSLKATHEYIADKKIINSGYSLVEYQTLLLKQLISNNSFGLVHNFNLSFVKKRIAMMKNKKSGWTGKVKVATAIAGTIICSAIIIQCNSRIDEQVSTDSEISSRETVQEISLPILPKTGYKFDGDPADALTFTIVENKLTINGEQYQPNEISAVIERGGLPSIKGHIVMKIDKNQKMEFVRKVEMELRKIDRRKILYLGQTPDGAKVETPIVLPSTPENALVTGVVIPPKISVVEMDGKTDILKIDVSDNALEDNQQKVFEFVTKHMKKQSTDYVVSVRYVNGDKYSAYLSNLIYVKEGFNQIYQARSNKMFGKDYFDVTKDEFKAVRENVPMAISIAEAQDL